MHPYTKGQATIELLLVLSVLLILLAVSINIFSNQQNVANQKTSDDALARNVHTIANEMTYMSMAPIGTKTWFFLPPGPVAQTFYVRNGFVEGYAGQTGIVVALPSKWVYSNAFYDGNFFTLTRDWNTVTVQAGQQ